LFGGGDHRRCRLVEAGQSLESRRVQRPLRPSPSIRRQVDGALEERRRGGKTASRAGAIGGALELGGDVLVRLERGVSAMPGAAIGVELRPRAPGAPGVAPREERRRRSRSAAADGET
jgi:hypothetical protein